MSKTERLQLPFIVSNQAQKEITHNEALSIIDMLTHIAAQKLNIKKPPTKPKTGELYIISDKPEGIFKDYPNHIAKKTANSWRYAKPVRHC